MKKVLIITDEKKSSYNQCDSLLYYLKKKIKLKTEYMRIERGLIHNLPNIAIYTYLFVKSFFKTNKNKKADFIISCGRISAPYSLIFKKLNKKCKIFHILDPYCLRHRFDKILIPGYMQEPIFAAYGIDKDHFWEEVNALPEIYAKRGT